MFPVPAHLSHPTFIRNGAKSLAGSRGLSLSIGPTGSGDGVKHISERAVQFGGTDSPLSPADLERLRLVQLPMVIGGIVPVVNLPGVADAALQLDGPVLADIMLGKIERWNDQRILQLNGAIQLPSLPIRRIVRVERSGTTEGFSRYLSMSSPTFRNGHLKPDFGRFLDRRRRRYLVHSGRWLVGISSWAVDERATVTAEAGIDSSSDPSLRAWAATCLVGLIYTLRPGFDIDVGYLSTIRASSFARDLLVGVTYRFSL
jgi:ABC-type phosphate transport system substrate-binding protein